MFARDHSAEAQARLHEQRSHQLEVRHRFAVPIYLSVTSDIPARLISAALEGINDAVQASGIWRKIELFSRPWGSGAHSSPDWYVAETYRRQSINRDMGFGVQLNSTIMGELLMQDPHQVNPHWDVALVNRDLWPGTPNFNFVFGQTRPSFPYCLQSVTRIMQSGFSPAEQDLMIKRLLRHEVGHMFGLVSRNFNCEESLGRHCTNICCMRQGLSLDVWRDQALEEQRRNISFCTDCRDELAERAVNIRPWPAG